MENTELSQVLAKLEVKIKELFASENTGHDIYHLERVKNLALNIQEKEGGDPIVIGISAYVHDIHRLMEKESGKMVTPKDSLPTIQKLLEEVNLPGEIMSRVLNCVLYHEDYNFSKNNNNVDDIETLILQDADNLDAIGAIGIGRTFTYGAVHNQPMWIPEIPFDNENYDASVRDISTIHHFYSKLLKLEENMNTETGKKLAKERMLYMKTFVDQFIAEWKGEK
jgi:uncharacterized protein